MRTNGEHDVLLASWEYWPYRGGIARYLHLLAQGLASLGLKVAVLSPFACKLESASITRLQWKLSPGRWWAPAAILGLVAALMTARPRLVVLGDDLATATFALTHRLTLFQRRPLRHFGLILHGTEVVLWRHRGPRWRLRRLLLRPAYTGACFACANSLFTAGLFRDTVAASVPVTVLGGAVQFATQRADAVNRDPSTLLSVCRLIPEKGVDVVLEALAVLAKRGKHLSYIVIGDGPDRARLQKLAKNLGLGAQVQFWGNVDDDMLEEAYARAAALVLMSRPGNRVEGLGLVFLEAQARGVPVIGARAMGIPEAVGEAGILVDHFLSPAAIADAIESLLGDPDLQRRLAEAGKERVRNLTPQAMAKRLLVVAREQGCLS